MVEPRNTSSITNQQGKDTHGFFQNFNRIPVDHSPRLVEKGFHSLSFMERQEIMEKLIDHVREI